MGFVWKTFLVSVFLMACASCDLAKDTADTSKGGAKNAAGIAGKMHNGTAGDADLDTGETPAESKDDFASGDSGGGG